MDASYRWDAVPRLPLVPSDRAASFAQDADPPMAAAVSTPFPAFSLVLRTADVDRRPVDVVVDVVVVVSGNLILISHSTEVVAEEASKRITRRTSTPEPKATQNFVCKKTASMNYNKKKQVKIKSTNRKRRPRNESQEKERLKKKAAPTDGGGRPKKKETKTAR